VLALLYDIHGNLPALTAVLAHAREAGVQRFLLGGDYAMAGAQPAECVARLRELEAEWIRGNTERWVNDPRSAPDDPFLQRAIGYARDQIGEGPAAELAALPGVTSLDGVLFCHGSPRSDLETFMPDPVPGEEDLMDGRSDQVVVFGHSHLQFMRERDGRLLVNPGSVGMPLDGDRRAAYAVCKGDRDFELRRVEYDWHDYLEDVRARMGPALGDTLVTLERRLEQATLAG
jgi:predicted phosphodiesterase